MRFGKYETVRLLGKGGMSEVYEVLDPQLSSRYALKLFTYDKEEPEVCERFLVEGRLLARLSHPRIVKVLDVGKADSGAPYMVMDLVLDERGAVRSLAEVQPGEADEDTVGRWYDDIREGLAYIHGKGVIHRDLKLENVLIGPDGHVVLTDFGVSRVLESEDAVSPEVAAVQTLARVREGRSLVMGSIGYMAPELEMGVAASRQSDWYALGVIVYRLLTGTWCDARTDVVGTLETYDPVWRRIIPALLHSNPLGRECLSYAAEKQSERERVELEFEERWLKEKSRGHLARHIARWLSVAVVLMMAAFAVTVVRFKVERRLLRAESVLVSAQRSPCCFSELFAIPSEAKPDAQHDSRGNLLVPSREELSAARIDLMVITYDLFDRFGTGGVSLEGLISALERMQEQFAEDTGSEFDGWPEGYMQLGDDETTYWMLERALTRLREIAER